MDAAGPVLRDIHLPAPPPAWPPAPGWWVLAVLVLAGAAVLLRRWQRRRQQRRARQRRERDVLAELDAIRAQWLHHGDASRLAGDLSHYLRRLSRAVAPDSVRLDGDAWCAFLARHGSADDAQALRDIALATFRPRPALDAETACAAVRRHALSVLREEWAHV